MLFCCFWGICVFSSFDVFLLPLLKFWFLLLCRIVVLANGPLQLCDLFVIIETPETKTNENFTLFYELANMMHVLFFNYKKRSVTISKTSRMLQDLWVLHIFLCYQKRKVSLTWGLFGHLKDQLLLSKYRSTQLHPRCPKELFKNALLVFFLIQKICNHARNPFSPLLSCKV